MRMGFEMMVRTVCFCAKLGATAFLILSLSHRSVTAATVTLFDGTFNNADWEIVTMPNPLPPGNGVTGSQIPVGGNPGAFREVRNSSFAGGTNGGLHFNVAQPYEPAVSGAIESLTYSEDSVRIFGPVLSSALAVRQDGLLYRSLEVFSSELSTTSYATNSLVDMTAEDFGLFFNGNFFPTGKPDFSVNGSAIEFGFMRSQNSVNTQSSTGIDNWQVVITTIVPEPTAAVLLSVSSVMLSARRR